MKKIFSILALMFFFSSVLVAQEPIDLPFSGEKGIINKSWRGHWAHSQIKGSPNYRPMPFYEGTYIFFKYGKSNKIAPSVRFKKLNEIHQDSSDPPYWTTIQKYSTEGTSNAWVLDPNDKPENTSKEVKIITANSSRLDYESTRRYDELISEFSYKIVQPEWKENISEIKKVCSNAPPIILKNYFKENLEMQFRLNHPHGEIVHELDPKELPAGTHKIWATFQFHNGYYAEDIDVSIMKAPEIRFENEKTNFCQSDEIFGFTVLVDGKKIHEGQWSGDGMDQRGNFNPSNAGVGKKLISYTYTNAFGCTSRKDLEVNIFPLPKRPVISGKTEGLRGEEITLSASAPNVTEFAWFRKNEHQAFFKGKSLTRTITQNEELFVRSLSDNGCFSEESAQISILRAPDIRFENAKTNFCQSDEIFGFTVFVDGEKNYGGQWSGDGMDQRGNFSPSNAGVGKKLISYSYTNRFGCTSRKDLEISVFPLPKKPSISGKTEGCKGEEITLNASAPNATEFVWFRKNEHQAFFQGKSLTRTITQNEELFVRSVSENGCLSEESTQISIMDFMPDGNIRTHPQNLHKLTQTDGLDFKFDAEGENEVKKYLWKFCDGAVSRKKDTKYYFNSPGTYNVTLTIESAQGCKKTIVYPAIEVVQWEPQHVNPPKVFEWTPSVKKPLELNLFPNPFRDWLKFTVTSDIEDVAIMRIFNESGVPVYYREIPIHVGENEVFMNDFESVTTILVDIHIKGKKIDLDEGFIKF